MGLEKTMRQKVLEIEVPKTFEVWRENEIARVHEICSAFDTIKTSNKSVTTEDLVKLKFNLERFPVAIIRLTRQICKCDEVCTQNSISSIKFPQCGYFDLKNIEHDDSYYDFGMFDRKVVNGSLVDINFQTDVGYLKREINKLVAGICKGNHHNLSLLKCKAYELAEYCGNDIACYTNLLNPIVPKKEDCTNLNFENDLNNIWSKIGYPKLIFQQSRNKREIAQTDHESCASLAGKNKYMPLFILLPFLALTFVKVGVTKNSMIMFCASIAIFFFSGYL